MSVTATAQIRRRPYPKANERDFSLPDSIWYAQGGVAGDVSGGFAEVLIILNAGGDTRSGRSWSLEISLPTISAFATDVRFRCNSLNMDNIGPGLNNPIQKGFIQRMPGVALAGAPEQGVEVDDMHPRIFLGSQGASAIDARLEGRWNNIDSPTFGWYASGYEWGPGALAVGIRRPIDGMFS